MKLASLAIAAVVLFAGAAGARESAASLSADQLGITCDRACLIDVMNQYLTAMIAHDPAKAPFGTHVKFTEDGVVLPIGTATWQTMERLGEFKQYFADPQNHSVAYIGTFWENGQESILSVRLKLNDHVIEEAEQLVSRGGGFSAPAAWDERTQTGTQRAYTTAGWDDTLKPSERVPRERMIAIANSYFSAIQGGAATPVPFAPGCYRIENGIVTSGTALTGPDVSQRAGLANHEHEHCADQLRVKGFFVFNTELRDRRYPVVDEEKGIVFSHVFFDHAGTAKFMTEPDGTKHPPSKLVNLPNSLAIDEIFWIKNGVIQHIAANIVSVPYGMRSGWEQ